MDKLEKEIRDEYARMSVPLARKGSKFEYGNTAEYWETLSQYGFAMAYYENQADAEQHAIEFYKKHMWLIRQ